MSQASEQSLASAAGAHESWARTDDRSARTAPARAAMALTFIDQAGGDLVKAEHLRKAYYARLSLAAKQARRKARDSERITDAIERTIESWPPLTPAQRDRIALLLRGGETT